MKFIKKSVSVFLAFLMIFGSVSMLASAEQGLYNWTTDTKFYRMKRNADGYIINAAGDVIADANDVLIEGAEPVWVETTKAKKGESLKAKVFLTTDFQMGPAQILFFYNTSALTFDGAAHTKGVDLDYKLVCNSDATNPVGAAGYSGEFDARTDNSGQFTAMINEGYLTEEELDGTGWIFLQMNKGTKAIQYDGKDWLYEFYFKAADSFSGTGNFYMPEQTIATYDAFMAATVLVANPDGDGTWDNAWYNSCDEEETGEWKFTLADKDTDSTLNAQTTLTFNAGEGKFTATNSATAVATGDVDPFKAAAGLPADPVADGKVFLGWVPSTKDIASATKADVVAKSDIKYGYANASYNALYESASGSYVLNTYTQDVNGDYQIVTTYPAGTVGKVVTYDQTAIPDGFTLDTSLANILTTTVTSDDSDVMTVYLKRNKYNVAFGDDSSAKYYESTYTAPAGPAKQGYTFTGWKADDVVLKEGESATVGLADVAYEAQYAPAANTAKVVINYIDQTTGKPATAEYPVATTTGYTVAIVDKMPETLAENTTYVLFSALPDVAHYEYTAEGSTLTATVADDGSTVLNINYVPEKYTATFTGADTFADKDYYTVITVPAGPAVAGQDFKGWSTDGSTVAYTEGQTFNIAENVTFTAIYEATKYNVTYTFTTEAPFDAPAATTGVMGDKVVLPEMAADGWTFLGWETTGDVNGNIGTADVAVEGAWIKNVYTVNFCLDDAATDVWSTAEYSFGDTIEVPEGPTDDYLEPGKYFDSWNIDDSMLIINKEIENDFAMIEDGKYVLDITATLLDYEYTVSVYFVNAVGYNPNTAVAVLEGYYYDDTVEEIDMPDINIEGHEFVNWKVGAREITFPYTVTGNTRINAYFNVLSYTATFYADGGAWLDGDTQKELTFKYGEMITDAALERPVREGYTFSMWDPEFSEMTTEGAEFYAFWTANKYDLTFDVEGVKTTSEQTFDKNITVPAEVVTEKAGYVFKGWTADGVTVITDITAEKVPSKDTTYTAVFEPDQGGVKYTVNRYFMGLDGHYASTPTDVIDTNKAVVNSVVNYNVAVEGFTIDAALGNTSATVKGDGSTVLNVYYERDKMTVTYVAQGNTVDTENVYYGADLAASKVYTAAPAGYNFLGWSRSATAAAPDATLGTMDSINGVTLYAVLDPIEYNTTFIIASEGTETTYKTVEVSYGAAIETPAAPSAEVPAGYKFVGWAATKGATEALADLGTMDTIGGKTFYAVLTSDSTVAYKIEKYFMGTDGKTYTLDATKTEIKADGVAGKEITVSAAEYEGFTFDADNANNVATAMIKGDGSTVFALYYDRNTVKVTINDKTEDKYYGEEITEEDLPEHPTTPEGMEPDGWVDENGEKVTFPVEIGTDDIVIKPNYKPSQFAITFSANGETVKSGDQTFGEILAVPAEIPTLAGNTFDGWYDAEGNKVVAGTTTVPAIATTYTAKFTPNNYTVTFMADGKQVATGDYAYGSAVVVPAYTAPAGFVLEGWSTNGATVLDMSKETVPVDGVTYYAVLKAVGVTYTIETYVQNVTGTDYEMTSETIEAVTGTAVNKTPDQKTGFKVDLDASVLNGVVAGDGSTTLKVYYNRNKYNVTIGTAEPIEYYYGASIDLGEAVPEAGYEFDRWVNAADNSTVASPFIVPAKDTIIDPVFVPVKYTVKFILNGQNYVEPVSLDFGTEIIAPETVPAVVGYTFAGWSTDGKNVITDLGTVKVGGNTFIAVMTANSGIEYTVNKIYQTVDGLAWGEAIPDVRTGTAGELITIDEAAEAAEGFTIESYDPASAKINGDGSTVFTIYYKRNIHSISIDGIQENVYYGSVIDRAEPTKAGYTFEGWFDAEGNEVTLPMEVNGDIVITSKLTPNTVSLSFENEGEVLAGYPTNVLVDSKITAPATPTKEGYNFVGWFIKGTSTMFTGTMPSTDTVYEAHWTAGSNTAYTIQTYMMDTNGEYTLAISTISYGVTGTMATIMPDQSNMIGFTHDSSIGKLSDIIAADGSTVLTVYYARDQYTVTWDVDGKDTVVDTYYGAAIVAPAEPTKTGFTFAGWTDADGNAVAATMPANNVEYFAQWEAAEYTITYVVNGDKYVETYAAGETVTVKDAPSVEGMKFNGWFDGSAEYAVGSTFTMPAENLIIVADFAVGVFKVTYLDAEGFEFASEMVRFGDAIPVPAEEPTKEFYTFKGWDIPYVSMPSNDITVAPIFERVPVKLIPMAGSTTIIDTDKNVIYGLQENLNETILRNSYLDVEGDGYFTITPVKRGYYGTGAMVELYDNQDASGTPIETYVIVVFGDINGDSRVEAIDKTYVDDEELTITNWSVEDVFENGSIVANPDYDPYKTMAADLNGDGMIDATDATIIGDATIGILTIDQVTGRTA